MKGILVSIHQRGSLIDLWIRDENNKKQKITISDFKPYFYAKTDYGEHKGIYGETLTRIYTKRPADVKKEREKYKQTWEADIPYTRRFLIDSGIYNGIEISKNQKYIDYDSITPSKVDVEPLILFLDIEVATGDGFPTPEKAEYPVISFSFGTNRSGKVFTYVLKENKDKIEYENDWIMVYLDNERDLLSSFCSIIEKIQPDIITGWNIINFDFLYLENRFKNLDLKWIDTRSFELFDLMEAYKKISSQPSYALKRIAEIEEIASKDEIESYKDVSEYYKTDIKRFAEYNRNDVDYLIKIDKKHSIIEYFLELKHLVGSNSIGDTFISSVMIDTMLLRIAMERGVVLPSKPEHQESVKYEGAHVMVEKAGLYNDIAVYDFTSYYPNIILNFNMSPENSKYGIIPELIERMLVEKKKISALLKDAEAGTSEHKSLHLRKEAVKRVVNAIYGVMAYKNFRLYKPEIPEKVTEIARNGIKYLISFGRENGYNVLLADTDSIFVQIPFDIVDGFHKTVNASINEYFENEYGVKTSFNLGFEKYIGKLLLTGVKKRYAMRIVYNGGDCDYVDVKGFESIRTDQSIFTRTLLKELFDLILYDSEKSKIEEFIHGKLNGFQKKDFYEIGISKGISKPFSEYGNVSHIRGSVYSNTYMGTNFHPGDKVKMLWVKGVEGLPRTDIICFDEDTDLSKYNIIVDWEHMKRVCLIDKVKGILDAIEIDIENKGKQLKL